MKSVNLVGQSRSAGNGQPRIGQDQMPEILKERNYLLYSFLNKDKFYGVNLYMYVHV